MKKNIFLLILALCSSSAIIRAIPSISLTDNDSYTQDSQIDGVDVSYTRNFTNVNWQAIYLPFSLNIDDLKDDFELAFIDAVYQKDNDDDGIIDEISMEAIKIKTGSTVPNRPYLIRAKTVGEKTIFVENATLYAAEEESVDCSTTIAKFTFTGNYSTVSCKTLTQNNYYAMDRGDLIHSNGSDLKPFRWYMKVESRNSRYNMSNDAKAIRITVIDE